MSNQDFLFEIGTEEIPAKQLEPLKTALLENVLTQLDKAGITYSEKARGFAAPRRLAIYIPELETIQPDQIIDRKGPSVQSAFDASGKPTKACEGFAKSCQIKVEDLEERDTPQGKWLFAKQHIEGKKTSELLPQMIQNALTKLPIAKPMHWGAHTESFLRPVRWLVMMLGQEIIPAKFFDLETGHVTHGHRFMAPEFFRIEQPSQYENLLASKGKVIVDSAERKKIIIEQLNKAAAAVNGVVCENTALLDEVTGLVEWPEALTASFDKRFLNVPENALIAAMEGHQKCFDVKDSTGKLLPYFLTVSNLVSHDAQQVIVGNERVMRARLSDAEYFYQKDLNVSLENYVDDLKRVVFQAKLGSLHAKSEALIELATYVAAQLKFPENFVRQAARLAKCDLRTQMVGEFPELQGEMGKIYAQKERLPQEVCEALFEQYLPRFANDELPAFESGIALALADRMLNLVGIFGIGQIPTGDKDPFALRRAAIGTCRIILDKQINLPLFGFIIAAEDAWRKQGAQFETSDLSDKVYDFIIERLRNLYLEEGMSTQVIQAVIALRLDNLIDINARIHAMNNFQTLPEAPSLAAAQKRVMNLFQKEKIDAKDLGDSNFDLFEMEQEKNLAQALLALQAEVLPDMQAKNYALVLQKMAQLKQPIDAFFDGVMVMAEDKKLRHNRLCLLAQLSLFLNQVADISCLVV